MEHPPCLSCSKCGLYKKSHHVMQPLRDERGDVRYATPRLPRVVFVTHYPTADECTETAPGYLNDGKEWVLDYLTAIPVDGRVRFEYVVTSLVWCHPGVRANDGGAPNKPTTKQVAACGDTFLNPFIHREQPAIIVALGGEVLTFLWPESRGTCPSISKARLMPIRLSSGTWLVAGYDPMQQVWYNQSDGKKGQDLTEEYIRMFTLLHDILDGKVEEEQPLAWSLVSTEEQMRTMLRSFVEWGVDKLYYDVETATWLLKQGQKVYHEDPDSKLPSKLTIFHEGSKLMCAGVTVVRKEFTERIAAAADLTLAEERSLRPTSQYETFVILPSAWNDNPRLFIEMFQNRVVEAWNLMFDGQATMVLDQTVDLLNKMCVYNTRAEADWGLLLPPGKAGYTPLNITLHDAFLLRGLRDQSRVGNGLEPSAVELCSIQPWSTDLYGEIRRVRERIQEQNKQRVKDGLQPIPELVTMDDAPIDIWGLYNGYDTRNHARIREEKMRDDQLGPDFPWAVYNMLIAGMGWIATMERNGMPVDLDRFQDTIILCEQGESQYAAAFAQMPEVQAACEASGQPEFNTRSPKFYEALIKELYGIDRFQNFPRTPSGRLASDKATIAQLAGEVDGAKVAWGDKNRNQRFWSKVMEWKNVGDDLSRLLGLWDYVTEDVNDPTTGRIRPSFRMLKTAEEEGSDQSGGASSGRIVASPNVLNLWERVKPIFRARKRYRLVGLDYGRIELAWIAWNTKDPLMMEWSRQMLDQHLGRGRIVWSRRTKNPPEAFDAQAKADAAFKKLWRSYGKTQNFATIYQEEPETTASKTLTPVDEVYEDLRLGRELHPKIIELQYDVYDRLEHGEMVKTCFGRCRSGFLLSEKGALTWRPGLMPAQEFFTLDRALRGRRNRDNVSIFNSIWNFRAAQADASDTTFCAGTRIHERLASNNWLNPELVREINYQYDALYFEIEESYLESNDDPVGQLAGVMADIQNLKLPSHFGLPLPVDAEVGVHLGKTDIVPGNMQTWDIANRRLVTK